MGWWKNFINTEAGYPIWRYIKGDRRFRVYRLPLEEWDEENTVLTSSLIVRWSNHKRLLANPWPVGLAQLLQKRTVKHFTQREKNVLVDLYMAGVRGRDIVALYTKTERVKYESSSSLYFHLDPGEVSICFGIVLSFIPMVYLASTLDSSMFGPLEIILRLTYWGLVILAYIMLVAGIYYPSNYLVPLWLKNSRKIDSSFNSRRRTGWSVDWYFAAVSLSIIAIPLIYFLIFQKHGFAHGLYLVLLVATTSFFWFAREKILRIPRKMELLYIKKHRKVADQVFENIIKSFSEEQGAAR